MQSISNTQACTCAKIDTYNRKNLHFGIKSTTAGIDVFSYDVTDMYKITKL